MTIIFFGSDPWFSPPILEALEKAGHEIVLIVTKGETLQKVAGQRLKDRIVQAKTAEDVSLRNVDRVLRTVLEISRTVLSGKTVPDAIVLAAFGPPFLENDILSWPKYGCLNVHASLLPRWRGASPISAAIAAGDKETGVSIMKMTEEIDRGPILGQKKIEISQPDVLRTVLPVREGPSFSDDDEAYDTRESLTKKLGILGGELIVETLKKLENDQIKFISQPEKSPTPYTRRLTKDSGRIDWRLRPGETSPERSRRIERFIRAVTPWPGAFTGIKDENLTLKILKAHLGDKKIVLDEVQLPGKNPISWQAFLAGHPGTALE